MKFLDSKGLSSFLSNLRNTFAPKIHKHTKSEITDFPTIPSKTSQLVNDSGYKTTDNNTTYTLSKSGSSITLTGSDGKSTTVTDSNTTYGAAGSGLGLVKTGGDVSISSGVITVNDDSHNHIIGNVDGLQSALDGKANTGHNHDDRYYTESEMDSKLNSKANATHTHNYAGSGTAGGVATSAAKLEYSRNIGLGAAVNSTPQKFDGTGNITIPVNSIDESYLTWGGRNIYGSISPVDAAASNIHSANRFQFAKPEGITIEYSTDGKSYAPYQTTNDEKVQFVSGLSRAYYLGGSQSAALGGTLRITLDANKMGVYTALAKLLIEYSTNGSTGDKVVVETAQRGSETNFTKFAEYPISGWSGWNSIPFKKKPFGGGENQTTNIGAIRLTFSYANRGSIQSPDVLSILAIGETYWATPSPMAKTGHLYEYDANQNVTFPSNVKAQKFIGTADKADALSTTSAGSSTRPVYFNNGKPVAGTYTLNKDVPSDAKFTDTWRGIQNNLTSTSTTDSLSAAQGKVLKELVDSKSPSNHTHTVDSSLSSTSTNPVQNKVINSALDGKVPTSRTINNKPLTGNITLNASDVGADASGTAASKANSALTSAKQYTDSQINAIVGEGAATTLDTIGEISAAIQGNQSMIDTLNSAIGSKANASDLNSHTGNTTVHITGAERTKWNGASTHANSAHAPANAEVNQNAFSNITVGATTISADTKTDTLTLAGSNVTITPDTTNDKVTIGITKDNVTNALGYTPPTTDTKYVHPTTSGNKHIPSGGSAGQFLKWSADGTAVWANDNNTTYSVFKGATATANGGTGLVPAPTSGSQAKYLRADGTWQTPPDTNTTYSVASSSNLGLTKLYAVTGNAVDGTMTQSAITNALNEKANSSHTHSASQITQDNTHRFVTDNEKGLWNTLNPVVTSGTGTAYTANINGITSLKTGMKITIVPHVVSASVSPTLNVNNLGAKPIRMPIALNTSATSSGIVDTWLIKDKPVMLEYDGMYWKTIGMQRVPSQYLYGTIPIEQGGTGATTAEQARINLGITSSTNSSVNENLLINADFRIIPIDQNVNLDYTIGSETKKTIDMWICYGANDGGLRTVSYGGGYLELSSSGSRGCSITQKLNSNYVNSDTYTLTIDLEIISGSVVSKVYAGGGHANFLKTGINTFTFTNKQITGVSIELHTAGTCRIKYIKLERGDKFTGMPEFDPALELIKCKRWYQAIKFQQSFSHTSSYDYVCIPLPVAMNGRPTITTNFGSPLTNVRNFTQFADKEHLYLQIERNDPNSYARIPAGYIYLDSYSY